MRELFFGSARRLPRLSNRASAVLLTLLFLALICPVKSMAVSQSVRLPNLEYNESNEDIKVKVLGGYVRINRSWVAGRWYLNPAWANLRFIPDPMGGELAVERAGILYKRTAFNNNHPVYAFGPDKSIAKQDNGWVWRDRLGNAVDYGPDGRVLSYSNPAGVKVSFEYDSQGRLSRALDHHGRPALLFESDSQGRVTRVSDATPSGAGRSVQYAWVGSGSDSRLAQVTDLLGNVWKYEYNENGQIVKRTDPLGASVELAYMSNPPMPPESPGFAGMGTGGGLGQGASFVGIGNSFALRSGGAGMARPSYGSSMLKAPQIPRVAVYRNEIGASANYRLEWDRVKRRYTIHIQEPGGVRSVRVYDKDGILLRESVEGLGSLQRTFDGLTQEKIVDARGLATIVRRNSERRPERVVYPDGSHESFEYDSRGRLAKRIDALGVVETWGYDAQGNETSHVEALGRPEQRTTLSVYDQWGQLVSRSQGAGDGKGPDAVAVSYAYDKQGNVIQATNGMNESVRAAYNSQGLPIEEIDGLNRSTRLAYDSAGNLTEVTNPLGETVRFGYDARGRRTQFVSAEGGIWRARYNAAGRPVEELAPGQSEGSGTRIEYDGFGRPAKTISPGGLATAFGYDALGRLSEITDPSGNVTSYEYGAAGGPLAGLLTAARYPTFRESYQYDQLGRRTAIVADLGGGKTITQRRAYDANGRIVSETDPSGNSVLYAYDALGRLTEFTNALAEATRQTWDAHDLQTGLTDAKGNAHRFEYDKAGRPVKETRPMGGEIQYAYDAAGYLIRRVDAGGNKTLYSWDGAGNLKRKQTLFADGAVDEIVDFSHNKDGELTGYAQTDGAGAPISRAEYDLDELGRRSGTKLTYAKPDGGGLTFALGQSYNLDGQLASQTYPDGSGQNFVYDKGRLSQIVLPDQSRIGYGDYEWLFPKRIDFPNGVVRRAPDALQRVVSIKAEGKGGKVLLWRSYQYDPSDNIAQIDSDSGKTDYAYDKNRRLTQARPDAALQAKGLPEEEYAYDEAGNRVFSKHQPGVWRYNQDNQLVQYPGALEPDNPASITEPIRVEYTAQGHASAESGGVWRRIYRYNAAERLVEARREPANGARSAVSFRYDPFGRRIAKFVYEGGKTNAEYYINGERALMAEADGDGRMTKAYGFNPDSQSEELDLWSSDPMWQADLDGRAGLSGASFNYIAADHLGAPILAIDKQGDKTWRGYSEAFGRMRIEAGSSAQINLRLPGQYYDRETGLHHNYFRDYSAQQGRYIQSDPIGLWGGVVVYSYAGGNALIFYDPYGLFGMDDVWGAVYQATNGWTPSQGTMDFWAGFGDGVIVGLTVGIVHGQDIRNALDISGGVDLCSRSYYVGRFTGTAAVELVYAKGAVPKQLIHYTTKAGASEIEKSGIRPSKLGFFGGGIYASSTGSYPKNGFFSGNHLVPKGSNEEIVINNTKYYLRGAPGTFVKPTIGVMYTGEHALYGLISNREIFIECCCKSAFSR